tara:strand:- start:1376 stop:2098 length:723 start_codon:yes stop_codon:yes gene_type:complete
MLQDLRGRASVTGEGRLVDLACGPGRVAIRMASYFKDILAIDHETEMIEVGRQVAARHEVGNIDWRAGRVEDLEIPDETIELITIGEAFHRLDQRWVLERSLDWLLSGACLTTLGCNGIRRGLEPWQDVLREVLEKWTGKVSKPRGAVRDSTRTAEHAEQVFRGAGFVDVQNHPSIHHHVWPPESIIGNLYSSSGNLRGVLGDDADGFEADLTRHLLDFDPRGEYSEPLGFGFTLGRKTE